MRAVEMAQWTKALATKPHDLGLSPGSHVVEGESQLLQDILWSPHPCYDMHNLFMAYVCPHINTINK